MGAYAKNQCKLNVILYEKNNRCEFDNVEKINYC